MGYNIFGDMFGDMFNVGGSFNKSAILNDKRYTENLDKMWENYSKGMIKQIVEYNKQIQQIKDAGLRVLRNSDGKHKIVE